MSFFRRTLNTKEFAPLTEEDTAQLLFIYRTRRRFLIYVFAGFVALDMKMTVLNVLPTKDPDFDFFRDAWFFWVLFFILLTVTCCISVLLYYTQIFCYKKDALSGRKCIVYETICGKEYFPITNQYFLALEDTNYLHHEVDEAIYNTVHEGDLFPIYFAQHSRYAFNKNGSFTLM